jgi:hypothetical protein
MNITVVLHLQNRNFSIGNIVQYQLRNMPMLNNEASKLLS